PQTPGTVRPHPDGEALHLRPGAGARGVRRAGHPQDRPRRADKQISILVADPGAHHQHPLPDEEGAMVVPKKALSRRTLLRGAGAAVALPLLDAMVPSLTAQDRTPAAPKRLRRLGYVYIPMGCDGTRWTPPGGDRLDKLSSILTPLAPVKDHVTVISNL